jgi:hypothetical protein
VTCRSCGHAIAEKAIVCYRCGAPTSEAAPPPRRASIGRWPWALVALAAMAVWVFAPGPPAGATRVAAGGVTVLALAVAFFLGRRR